MRRTCMVLLVVTLLTGGLQASDEVTVPIDRLVEGISCIADPSQTYSLYLPPGFSHDKQWPVLLIFDPRGRSVRAANLFLEAAREYGWILVSSNDTRSDGPMEPNVTAINALWPEVHNRIPGDPQRMYATGFSGGSAFSFMLAGNTKQLAGVIAVGGRYLDDLIKEVDASVFTVAGDVDFNYPGMRQVDDLMEELGNPHRFESFSGDHRWMPESLAHRTVAWMQLDAMRRELIPADPAAIATLFEHDLAMAKELVENGELLRGTRRLRAVERTFSGLTDVQDVAERAASMERGDTFRELHKSEERWFKFEIRFLRSMDRALSTLRYSEIPPPTPRMARDFRIDELIEKSEQPGIEGTTATRCLNALLAGLSFYLPRDFRNEKRYAHAVTSLELATRVRGEHSGLWYNLACARALAGRDNEAVEALAEAVNRGFDDRNLLASDSDLDSLREKSDFKQLLR